jgi:hypothetical protein
MTGALFCGSPLIRTSRLGIPLTGRSQKSLAEARRGPDGRPKWSPSAGSEAPSLPLGKPLSASLFYHAYLAICFETRALYFRYI